MACRRSSGSDEEESRDEEDVGVGVTLRAVLEEKRVLPWHILCGSCVASAHSNATGDCLASDCRSTQRACAIVCAWFGPTLSLLLNFWPGLAHLSDVIIPMMCSSQ